MYLRTLFSLIAGCIIGSLAVNKLDKTVEHITKPPEISTVMSVYVLKEISLQILKMQKISLFAVNDSYNKSDNDKIINQLTKQFNKEPNIMHYETMLKSVDALYKKQADVLIISESNVVILEDLPGYEPFEPNKNPESEENIGEADDPFIIYISGSYSRNGIMNRSLSDVNILAVAHTI